MKPSLSIPLSRLVVVALVSGSTLPVLADQPAAPVYPQYAATYYPPQKPSVVDRLRNAGQNVGDFVRRKFYGENGPAGYQQPAYQTPGGYRTQRYNLDAPAASLDRAPALSAERSPTTTGFQEPTRSTVPKYQTPPKEEAVPASKSSTRSSETSPTPNRSAGAKQTSAKTKPAPAASKSRGSSRDSDSSERTSQTRYAPAKPSSFAKTSSKTPTAKKRVDDDPPATTSRSKKSPSSPTVVHHESPPTFPKEPQVEAKLKTEGAPPMTNPTENPAGGGIAPTIGGTDFDLTPQPSQSSTGAETTNKPSDSDKTEKPTNDGDAKSGSFMVGKKGSKPGRVVSPYPPYNELDITGLPTGSLALDPTTQKVFQVP